jgi:hypothetical protein
MKKGFFPSILVGFFFIIGVVILLEQYLNYGVWFELKDIHHETFALASFALAIGIIIGYIVPKE